MTRTVHRRSRNSRRGATVVEFSVVFSLFMFIVFFFFESWRFMMFQQAVDQAALEAARAAIVPGATVEQANERASMFLNAVGASTATVATTPNPIQPTTEQVTVTVTLPYADVGFFFAHFSQGYVFTSMVTLDHENRRIARR